MPPEPSIRYESEPPPSVPPSSSPPPSSRPFDADDELVGSVLGGAYHIVRVVGEGGTGRVYQARHTRIGAKRFAVKVLHPEFVRHPEAWVRFQREAEAAAAIDHENVVDVVDVDRTADGRPYVVFEFLEGVELMDYIERRGPLPPPLAANIVQQVCAGLAEAHARGVMHRDVKPQNIWLMGDLKAPLVKVLDFGLSRPTDDLAPGVTKSGAVLGTPAYMPPEQARGERVDIRADVYGAGTVLYTSLTGKPPFAGETVQQTLVKVMGEEPRQPRTLVPIIPENLELVIQRAMAKEPHERYSTVDELYEALEPFVDRTVPLLPPSVPPPSRASAESPRATVVLYLGAAALLILVGATTLAVGLARSMGLVLTSRELVLVALAVAGTGLSPAWLAVRHIRRHVWGNGHRVRRLRRRLRDGLVAAVAGYGLSAMAVRFLDTVLARFIDGVALGLGAGWVPFNALHVLVAALCAAVAVSNRSPEATPAGVRLRTILLTLLVPAFVAGAMVKRATTQEVARLDARLAPIEGAAAAGAARARSLARVTDVELEEAIARGVEALDALRREHPDDPRILGALALAHGASPSGYTDAVAVLDDLFGRHPDRASERALQALLSRAARHGDSRDAALEVALARMGTPGLDLLYRWMVEERRLRPRIEAMLASSEVRPRLSGPLAVAFDLFVAEGCGARRTFLERATRDGDERTIAILQPLATGTDDGCGPYKRRPCDPPCEDEAEDFRATVQAIRDRLGLSE